MIQLSRSKCARLLLIATAAAATFGTALALADPDKGESGHGPKVEVHDNGKDYKYEYKDRRCKYEYKLNYRTGEEKIEQKGDCRGVSPRRAVYPDVEVYHEHDHEDEYEVAPRSSGRIACNRDVIGAVIGGVMGGVAGSNVGSGDGRKVATVAGAIIGAVIGGNIGGRMDRADDGCAYQAFEFAAPGETVFWRNPDSRIEYGITPDRRVRRRDGRECREYKVAVAGGGVTQKSSSGVACRNSSGAWQIE
ncbi:MAG TPA: glycine zipper 2TM domain-containing protein [Steroidobacter sp.]|uniref:glycine zipper 2TM domain-containing protein n=1 Tax=Steroidobacter sp. TaxID=1978227 RepID=UPI002ED9171A